MYLKKWIPVCTFYIARGMFVQISVYVSKIVYIFSLIENGILTTRFSSHKYRRRNLEFVYDNFLREIRERERERVAKAISRQNFMF